MELITFLYLRILGKFIISIPLLLKLTFRRYFGGFLDLVAGNGLIFSLYSMMSIIARWVIPYQIIQIFGLMSPLCLRFL